ncbi:MAG: chloramphenicol acetyltransferase [Endomicrobiia bacterium]|nr:chloramphenicol acetyltransferase [Endomicrobiia bacterium]
MEKIVDIKNSPRAAHFAFFNAKDYPLYNLCVPVDVTRSVTFAKERGLSIFRVILYAAVRAANDVPEFRRRLRHQDIVVEHDVVHPSFTVMAQEEVFSFCTVDYNPDLVIFLENVERGIAEVKKEVVLSDDIKRDDFLFITSIPWLSFTSFVHPIHIKKVDSVPRLAWGKYYSDGGLLKLPFSAQVHHALMDGIHVAKFFAALEGYFASPERTFSAG